MMWEANGWSPPMPVYKASELKPLFSELENNQHRQLFLICGAHDWAVEQLGRLFQLSEDSLVLSKHQGLSNACWPEHLHQILGQEFELAVYDGYAGINPNKLAALSGTVKAGGLMVLLLPELAELADWVDPSAATWCSFGYTVTDSPFLKRWQNSLTHADISYWSQVNGLHLSLNGLIRHSPATYTQQQEVVSSIGLSLVSSTPMPVLLSADRGRGKSAALGLLAASMAHKQFIICALQYRAVKNSFKHLAQALGLTYQGHEKQLANLKFVPPDQLLSQDLEGQVLLIDEAASIPVPILIALSRKTSQCVFSSTIIGYEGNGRGYTLRFQNYLKQQYPNHVSLILQHPIRYQDNDPLERVINQLFALDCRYPIVEHIDQPSFCQLDRTTLADDEALLQQAFALLVLAHYQTTVNDLRQLLDSPSNVIFAIRNQKQLLGLCLVNLEGQLPDELHRDIAAGVRRPQGHLLPQQLFSAQGDNHFLKAKFARVVRIVITPELHQKGLGSDLLNYAESQLSTRVDYFGSSFGATAQLLNFWQKNSYQLVRLGFKQDKASGEYAAMVVKSRQRNHTHINDLSAHFRTNFSYQLLNHYQRLPWQLVKQILTAMPNQPVPPSLQAQLKFLATRGQMLEQDSATIWHILLLSPKLLLHISDISQQLGIRLLLQNNTKAWLASDLNLTSRKQFDQALNTLVHELYGQLTKLH
ncbi:GNAT family N-acetyltransferase [Pseudoalteromonas sp. MMG022]|uniref:GNAT family N-acetyltransferase n=1 Tax=Pseudoalteromonas sp. MMG022 TaxID=2909978 RepID=UPI001F02AF14|nr:GNAT family N-acetyltransferase [Pseudoalteromonas sp. MMG022]MCF6436559.1 GNAT family N-acetyltransferase [Pseudoalteromonas sp. MMG022]